jgi:Do/DeqQ family serine protease
MNKKQFYIGLLFASIFGGMVAIAGFKVFEKDDPPYESIGQSQNFHFSNFLEDSSYVVPEGLNFVYAAELVTPTVVHIKSFYEGNAQGYAYRNPFEDMFRDFFGDPGQDQSPREPRQQQSAGSGVIISGDGFIVTNNHVIADASKIEITLNDKRTFEAKLIGTDPNTDIAVLKIEARGLPYVKFGDSDRVRVGEWVLAVGNPFDLTSTVTAGIVSAKGRNINILRKQYGIEAFIQTDAAVNPGNSGGALVNLKGELIGINTAIATPTGSYTGYSFAVPVSLVSKVVEDLVEFGIVQRAILGISIANTNDPRIEEKLDELQGVYIMGVNEGSAADEVGLEKGDVITEINDQSVTNVAELQDMVARNRPGDKITVTYTRDGRSRKVSATLKNIDNEIKVVKAGVVTIEGAQFTNASQEMLDELNIDGGVVLDKIGPGKWRNAGLKEGFVITSIDKKPVKNVNELRNALRNKEGEGVLIAGVYPDGEEAYYGMGW